MEEFMVELTTTFAYMELRIGGEEPEPRIIGPLLEELPLEEWVKIMWPEERSTNGRNHA